MLSAFRVAVLGIALSILMGTAAFAAPIETKAREAFMIDMSTGTVLLDKNADQRMPTSSMSKVMTMYMVFDALKNGKLGMGDEFTVTENAWRMQGSKMFVELGKKIRVEDLIRGVIIQSGNDATVVLAEGMAGSEQAFAERLNAKAGELGMTNSHFMNASGWPDPDHYSTARDLALLAWRTIQDFPEYYPIYSEKEFTWHGIKQGNRNPLLYRNIGVDGLKTGHAEEAGAGYGLIASAEQNGRRLILVVNGLGNMQERADESARLLDWGFREFNTYNLLKAGDEVEQAPVWLGKSQMVSLLAGKDGKITLSRADRRGLQVKVKYDAPVPAPIAKGQEVGKIMITAPNMAPREIPLVAGADVERLGLFARIKAAARYKLFGPDMPKPEVETPAAPMAQPREGAAPVTSTVAPVPEGFQPSAAPQIPAVTPVSANDNSMATSAKGMDE